MRQRNRERRGGAVVEFAIILPFLIYLAVIGTDWARLLYFTITVEECARAGALWQADTSSRGESGYTTVTAAALSSAPGLTPTPTVTVSSTTVSGRTIWQVTVSMPFTTITNLPGIPQTQTVTRTVEMREFPTAPN
jgi:Flp pilus assembly protein TadG